MTPDDFGPGRTLREGIDAGDLYLVKFRRHNVACSWDGESLCPGTRGIDEAVTAARSNHPHRIGQRADVRRVMPGSSIGCMILEHAGSLTL